MRRNLCCDRSNSSLYSRTLQVVAFHFPSNFSRRKKVDQVVRAASKLVWVSFCLLWETSGAWLSAQGPDRFPTAPRQAQRPTVPNSSLVPRQARRDVAPVDGWPSFADTPPAKAGENSPTGQSVPAFGAIEPAGRAEKIETFDLAQIVAQVGDQYILKGELIADANLLFQKEFTRLEQMPAGEQPPARAALLAQRDLLVEQLLQQTIDRKLMYLEYLRSMPADQDDKKIQEKWKEIRKRVGEVFRKQLVEMCDKIRNSGPEQYAPLVRQNYQLFRVALVMKDANIESPDDPRLERLLRENGTSLYTQQQAFMERALGQSIVGQKVNFHPEITHDQMLSYYREHLDESQVPTRAKWEQLTVLFARFKDKFEAGEAIASMGNQVVWGGTQFWAVARKHSHERNAEKGGFHDWTALGDLKISKELNNAVFTLPIGELSEIIQDDEGLHIIRVLEREEAHVVPFTEAQVDIKESLRMETLNKAYGEYVAKLREKTPILTPANGPVSSDRRATSERSINR